MSDDYVELVVKVLKEYSSGKAIQVQTPSGKKFNVPLGKAWKGDKDTLEVWQKVEIAQSILEDDSKHLTAEDITLDIPGGTPTPSQPKPEVVSASELLKQSIDNPDAKPQPKPQQPKPLFAKKLEKVAPSSSALVDPHQKKEIKQYEKMTKWELYDMERLQIQPCATLDQWLMFVKYCQEQHINYAAREVYLAIKGGIFRMRDRVGNEFIGPYKGSYKNEERNEIMGLSVVEIIDPGQPQIMESIQYKRKNIARAQKQASPIVIEFSEDGERWTKYWAKTEHPKIGRARGYLRDFPDKEFEIVRWFSECYKDNSDSWKRMPNQMFKKSLEAEWLDKAAAEHAHAQAYEPGVFGYVPNSQGIMEEDQIPLSKRTEPLLELAEACEKNEEAYEKLEQVKVAEKEGNLEKIALLKKEIAELSPAQRAEEAKEWEQMIKDIYEDNYPIINELLQSHVGDELFGISHGFTEFTKEHAKEIIQQLIKSDDVYYIETLRAIVEDRKHLAGDIPLKIKTLPKLMQEAVDTIQKPEKITDKGEENK